jgi:hypothetical protein
MLIHSAPQSKSCLSIDYNHTPQVTMGTTNWQSWAAFLSSPVGSTPFVIGILQGCLDIVSVTPTVALQPVGNMGKSVAMPNLQFLIQPIMTTSTSVPKHEGR